MILKNAQQTKQFAKEFIEKHPKAHIIALFGELGAGKTTFVQGMAEGLGVKKRVLSPTFVFQRSYELSYKGLKRFHHLDLYRLTSAKDALSIGIEEILSEDDVLIVIEWPEIAEKLLPKDTIRIYFKKISEKERELTVENP